MFRKRLEEVGDWLLTQQENLEKNERDYTVRGAARVHAQLQNFVDGSAPGKVNVQPQQDLNLLGWQIVDGLNVMANRSPDIFRQALRVIWAEPQDPGNADAFWSALDPALDGLTDIQRKHFSVVGTRASVASYFLFLADPLGQPFYRPNFGGKAVEWLYDKKDGLDRRSVGSLLTDYVGRCRYLQRQFQDAGVPLQDMLDTQGALYIVSDQYLKISRPARDR